MRQWFRIRVCRQESGCAIARAMRAALCSLTWHVERSRTQKSGVRWSWRKVKVGRLQRKSPLRLRVGSSSYMVCSKRLQNVNVINLKVDRLISASANQSVNLPRFCRVSSSYPGSSNHLTHWACQMCTQRSGLARPDGHGIREARSDTATDCKSPRICPSQPNFRSKFNENPGEAHHMRLNGLDAPCAIFADKNKPARHERQEWHLLRSATWPV